MERHCSHLSIPFLELILVGITEAQDTIEVGTRLLIAERQTQLEYVLAGLPDHEGGRRTRSMMLKETHCQFADADTYR